ncbi:sulfotransferase [Thiohalocapsa halophila]|uniref:sulfotransferase n=1 Tax=Thiohalocapsa halophila TaxID=69359 RepID=UPI0019076D63|nr:sulfotransferase [Thiohalocapsa halophila]
MTAEPVFLVSTGRTGTRFLAEVFAKYGRAVASHHTTTFTRPLNILNNLVALGVLPRALPNAWADRLLIPRISTAQDRWIECNPYYAGSVALLRRRFPGAYFVMVVRHPQAFCNSHLRWERQRLASRIANQLIPAWAPISFHEQLLGLMQNENQRIRYYAKVWSTRNEIILNGLSDHRRSRILRFEDIFDRDMGGQAITNLFDWLRLPVVSYPINIAPGDKPNRTVSASHIEWNDRRRQLIYRHCGSLMLRLGYEVY